MRKEIKEIIVSTFILITRKARTPPALGFKAVILKWH